MCQRGGREGDAGFSVAYRPGLRSERGREDEGAIAVVFASRLSKRMEELFVLLLSVLRPCSLPRASPPARKERPQERRSEEAEKGEREREGKREKKRASSKRHCIIPSTMMKAKESGKKETTHS